MNFVNLFCHPEQREGSWRDEILRVAQDESEQFEAAFQAAIVDVLVAKSLAALSSTGMTRLVVAGGVGANKSLREKLTRAAKSCGATVYYPPLDLCTDNGAMIAFAAAMRLGDRPTLMENSDKSFNIKPRWPLEEISAV